MPARAGFYPGAKTILAQKREALLQAISKINESIAYIDWKQSFYDDVLSGRQEYYSNLLRTKK